MDQKCALVTGSNRGIGFAIAKDLLKQGMKVAVCCRRNEDATEAVKSLASDNAFPFACDVVNEESCKSCVAQVQEKFGRIDILVNNAGGSFDLGKECSKLTNDELSQAFGVNLFSAINLTRYVLPGMLERKYGRIVNVSSKSGSFSGSWYNAPGSRLLCFFVLPFLTCFSSKRMVFQSVL